MSDATGQLLIISAERRLVDQVYERLRSAIIKGVFEPGQRLVERDLTTQLDVSRTPIREALKQLEQDGLVVCYPHRGSFVRQPTFDEARQAYELRRALEGLAAELAATRATDEEIDALHEAVEKGTAALKTGNRLALLLHNSELHLLIAKASHNTLLERQFREMWSYVHLLRGSWWAQTSRPDTGHPEHRALVAAIARRNPTLARQILEEHVSRAWENIARRFNSGNADEQRAEDAARTSSEEGVAARKPGLASRSAGSARSAPSVPRDTVRAHRRHSRA